MTRILGRTRGRWRWLRGERFGFGEPSWVPRAQPTPVTAKAEGWANALRTTVTQNLTCAPHNSSSNLWFALARCYLQASLPCEKAIAMTDRTSFVVGQFIGGRAFFFGIALCLLGCSLKSFSSKTRIQALARLVSRRVFNVYVLYVVHIHIRKPGAQGASAISRDDLSGNESKRRKEVIFARGYRMGWMEQDLANRRKGVNHLRRAKRAIRVSKIFGAASASR